MTIEPVPAFRAAGQPCSEADFYRLACDPQRSIAVEACAGSGKTWILVSRIVRALLAGTQPQEILALTFTRKAAGEMRQRLHQELARWAECAPQQRVQDLVSRGLPNAEALAQQEALAQLQERLAASGRDVAIETLNAWFAQLLLQAPSELLAELGLSADMQPIEEVEPWMPQLKRRLYRWIRGDAQRSAEHRLLLRRHGKWRLDQWWDRMLASRVEIARADAAGRLEHGIASAAAYWPQCPAGIDPALLIETDAPTRALLVQTTAALLNAKEKAARDLGEALSNALADPDIESRFEAVWTALHKKNSDEPRQVSRGPVAEPLLLRMQELQQWRIQQQAHEDQQALARLSRGLLAQWQQLKRERRLVDMIDLELCGERLLNDPVASGWVQQRLDRRWRMVLVDEFQDTSALQWQALQGWLAGYAGAGGGSPMALFVVGDPKQSIYRFRRAEPRVFQAAAELVVQGLDGVKLECDHTRRCGPAVRDLVNHVIGAAQTAGDYHGFRDHSTSRGAADGGVCLLERVPRPPRKTAGAQVPPPLEWRDSLTEPKRETKEPIRLIEAAQVADAVRALKDEQAMAWSDILVLASRRVPLGTVAQALRQRGVPCVAGEKLRLIDLPEVADLLALLDLLASPGHDLSLAQALRSPAFGADDNALAALARRARESGRDWADALAQWTDAPPPLDRARGLLSAWAEPARRLHPHDLLDRVLGDTDFLAQAMARARPHRRELARRAVQGLLWQALRLDSGRCTSPYRFVRALRAGAASLPASEQWDAVRVMTIHGAKGLEARAVFLVDTDAERAKADEAGLLVDWPIEQPAPRQVAFHAGRSRMPASLQPLWAGEQAERERERINLLYVALSRAKDWLVASATEPYIPEPGPSWWARLQPHAPTWAAPAVPAAPDASAGASRVRVPALPPWAGTAVAVRTAEPGREDEAARLGTAWHRLLEWALQPGAQPLPALAQAVAEEAGLSAAHRDRLLGFTQRLQADPALAPLLAPSAIDASNEVALVVDGQVLRIDRLVALQRDGHREWWVLDYKLATRPLADAQRREQLARYRRAVQALQPGEVVRAAFVTAQGELVELPD